MEESNTCPYCAHQHFFLQHQTSSTALDMRASSSCTISDSSRTPQPLSPLPRHSHVCPHPLLVCTLRLQLFPGRCASAVFEGLLSEGLRRAPFRARAASLHTAHAAALPPPRVSQITGRAPLPCSRLCSFPPPPSSQLCASSPTELVSSCALLMPRRSLPRSPPPWGMGGVVISGRCAACEGGRGGRWR